MLIDIPEGRGPGTWTKVLAHTPEPEYRPFWTAMVTCPDCGARLYAVNHTIDASGQISPSLGHPANYVPCGWHTSPRLVGWQQWPVPKTPRIETCARCNYQAHMVGGWGTWSGGGIICQKCVVEVRAATTPEQLP